MTTDRGRGRHRANENPPAPEPGPAAGGRWVAGGGTRWLTALLTVLGVLAAVAVVVFGLHDRSAEASDSSRTAAVAAARTAAQDVLSYDYRSLDKDIAQARAETTGMFRTQYDDTAKQLLSQAAAVKAIVQASVGTAGVVSAGSDHVVVLLFIDQASVKQLAGSATPTTRIDQSRVRMTMTRVHGRWLVSALSAL